MFPQEYYRHGEVSASGEPSQLSLQLTLFGGWWSGPSHLIYPFVSLLGSSCFDVSFSWRKSYYSTQHLYYSQGKCLDYDGRKTVSGFLRGGSRYLLQSCGTRERQPMQTEQNSCLTLFTGVHPELIAPIQSSSTEYLHLGYTVRLQLKPLTVALASDREN